MDNAAESYRRFLEGDDSGMTELIGEYSIGLSLYINSIVRDICLAEDIMQETFVKLAVKRPEFSGTSSFGTWLFTIARNTALDILRKRSRSGETQLDEAFLPSDEADIEKEYLREEQKIELHRAIKTLSPDYRQALYLVFFEGFSTAEAAKIMGKSRRQVSDILYRAKKSLKNELERAGFNYEEY